MFFATVTSSTGILLSMLGFVGGSSSVTLVSLPATGESVVGVGAPSVAPSPVVSRFSGRALGVETKPWIRG